MLRKSPMPTISSEWKKRPENGAATPTHRCGVSAFATEVVCDRFDPNLAMPASSVRVPGMINGDAGIAHKNTDEIGLNADLDGNDLEANASVVQE